MLTARLFLRRGALVGGQVDRADLVPVKGAGRGAEAPPFQGPGWGAAEPGRAHVGQPGPSSRPPRRIVEGHEGGVRVLLL